MKTYSRLTLALLLAFLVIPQVTASGQTENGKKDKSIYLKSRTWTSRNGKHNIKGSLDSVGDGKVAIKTIDKTDGTKTVNIKIAYDKLSTDDLDFILEAIAYFGFRDPMFGEIPGLVEAGANINRPLSADFPETGGSNLLWAFPIAESSEYLDRFETLLDLGADPHTERKYKLGNLNLLTVAYLRNLPRLGALLSSRGARLSQEQRKAVDKRLESYQQSQQQQQVAGNDNQSKLDQGLNDLRNGQLTVEEIIPLIQGKGRDFVVRLFGPPDSVRDRGKKLYFKNKAWSKLQNKSCELTIEMNTTSSKARTNWVYIYGEKKHFIYKTTDEEWAKLTKKPAHVSEQESGTVENLRGQKNVLVICPKLQKPNEKFHSFNGHVGPKEDLSNAMLAMANLRNANLRGANLSGANLQGATLAGADLRGADISGTNLNFSDLSGCDFTRVKNLEKAKFGLGFYTKGQKPKFPADFSTSFLREN